MKRHTNLSPKSAGGEIMVHESETPYSPRETPRTPRRAAKSRNQVVTISLPPLKPIRSRREFKDAFDRCLRLSRLQEVGKLTRDEIDYNAVLSLIIRDWESKTLPPMENPTPLDILEYLMEEHKMSASDLGRILGHRELGSRILKGQRELSKQNIRALAEHFKVSPACFL